MGLCLHSSEMKGPPAVVKVLAKESERGEGMEVGNQGLRSIDHRVAAAQPALAEFTVLCGCARKDWVKAADLQKRFLWQGQVVGRKESCLPGIRIIVGVEVFDQEMGGF